MKLNDALKGVVLLTLVASSTWSDDRVAELEKKLVEARAKVVAAEVEVKTLEAELERARIAEADAAIDRAVTGDPAAVDAALEQLNNGVSFIPYRYSRIVKDAAGAAVAERIFAKVVAADDSTTGSRRIIHGTISASIATA